MIRVIVVDDSAVERKVMMAGLSKDPEIEVVATAPDPFAARNLIVQLKPDVVTLDIEMPRMNGVAFLKKLMHYYPIPVVMVSSHVGEGREIVMSALDAGAVDVVAKPTTGRPAREMLKELAEKIKQAAGSQPRLRRRLDRREVSSKTAAVLTKKSNKVIAIGASTGGTEALRVVLTALPADSPPVLVVQHMPEGFTAAFADRLDSLSKIHVKEAEDGDPVLPGQAIIARGNRQMEIVAKGTGFAVRLNDGPLVSRHKPSVDVLFRSAAKVLGNRAIGVILTGMGRDGADGMLEMHEAGAVTFAQDEESCVVFGMPKEAIKLDAVDEISPLSEIRDRVLRKA